MALRLTIDALGDKVIDRSLLRVAHVVDDLTDVWDRVDEQLNEQTDRQFESEGQYGSLGWPALAPSTKAQKAARGQDPRILHRTLELRNSLTSSSGSGHVFVSQPHEMVWGTTVEHGIFHQQGRGVPERKVVQMPEAGRREVVKTLQDSILGAWL